MKRRPIPKPNFTQTPNIFFDEWLKEIATLAEERVILIVMRYTFGWHDTAAGLTLDQFQSLTGLERAAVVNGIKRAIDHGFITREQNGHGRIYRIATKGVVPGGLKSSQSEPSQEFVEQTSKSLPSELFSNLNKEKRKKGRKKGEEISLPEEMRSLTPEMRKAGAKAEAAGLDLELEHEHFVAHADQHGITNVSWAGAWRTWLVKSIKFKKDRDTRNPPAPAVESRRPLHEQIGDRKK